MVATSPSKPADLAHDALGRHPRPRPREAPFNAGTFLLATRNTSHIYTDGLRALQRCAFTVEAGWDGVGAPNFLAAQAAANLGKISCFPPPGRVAADECHLATHPIRRLRTWSFVCARSDQGFFFYMLALKHGVAALTSSRSPHRTIHWWGANKPWARPVRPWSWALRKPYAWLQHSYEYVSRLQLLDDGARDSSEGMHAAEAIATTPCVRHLFAYRRDMEKAPNFERPWNASARAPAIGGKGSRFTIGYAPSLNFRPAF